MKGVTKVNNATEHKITETTEKERRLDFKLGEICSLIKIFLIIKK